MGRRPNYHKEYQELNKEKIKEYGKQYRLKNKEKILEQQGKYRKENRDKVNEYYRNYTKQNKKHISKRNRERDYDIKKQLINEMGGKCVCCGLTSWWILTLDHIKPVKKQRRGQYRTFILKLLNNPNMRKDFQVMCYGCNNSKNIGDKCLIH